MGNDLVEHLRWWAAKTNANVDREKFEQAAARIEALERALKPFADQAKTHSDKMPDEMFIDDYEQHDKSKWVSHAGIRVGDLRRAARAYSGTSG